jgi:glyoxylate reductase
MLASYRFPGPAFDELVDVELLTGPLPDGLGGARPGVGALAIVHELLDEQTLARLPDLKLVANYGVGYDGIDVAACARHGVAVTNTPGVLDAATADLAFALMLACRRRVVEGDALLRWSWPTESVDSFLADELAGTTLGIVGLGRIGRAVARRARAFEMRVLIYKSGSVLGPRRSAKLNVDYRGLDELLAEADSVTLHVPLRPDTINLINGRRLALMRPGACLVNTARGPLIDEAALVAVLAAGRIRAGLDVFTHEPHVPKPLLKLPNVVLTPHIGSATRKTREAMTRVLVDIILAAE